YEILHFASNPSGRSDRSDGRNAPRNPTSGEFDFNVASFCTPNGAKKTPSLPLKSKGIENGISVEIGWSPPSDAVAPVVYPGTCEPGSIGCFVPPQSSTIASRVPRKSLIAIVTNASFHRT